MLAKEYRMHPHIAEMMSALFYNSQPIDITSILQRDEDRTWRKFTAGTIPQMPCAAFNLYLVYPRSLILHHEVVSEDRARRRRAQTVPRTHLDGVLPIRAELEAAVSMHWVGTRLPTLHFTRRPPHTSRLKYSERGTNRFPLS